ncbi:HTH_Tnp_Tc3_2 domain-containing protein [Trichonephila clavipes]|nr:HTH_Tnp_Tc3_2 domain-containing protein [Trichonephila clavipes]
MVWVHSGLWNCAISTLVQHSSGDKFLGSDLYQELRLKAKNSFRSRDGPSRGEFFTQQHEGTLNSRRAASPLVWLVEGEGPWQPTGFSPSKLGWNRAKSYCHLSSGIANSDEQKANQLVLTLKYNFTENKRPDDKIYPIDDNITNTLKDFLSHPPPLPIAPTNPDEITDYFRSLPNNKAPGSDNITNTMKQANVKSIFVSVVCNLWKQFQDTGSIERKPGQDRPKATTAKENYHLSIITRRSKGATAPQLSRYLYAAIETRVSRGDFKTSLERVCQKTCCLHPAHVYEQESPFSMVQTA